VLDARELSRLLAVVERDDVWARHFPGKRERDRLLLALFAFAGLRRGELLGLDWARSNELRSSDSASCAIATRLSRSHSSSTGPLA
jgi:site-specific recombinase XerC